MTFKRNLRAFFLAFVVSLCILLLCGGLTWAQYNTAQILSVSEGLPHTFSLLEGKPCLSASDAERTALAARFFSSADKMTVLLFEWCCETAEQLIG